MMAAISEGFLKHFEELVDPRADNANRRHELGDMLLLTILAVICGADSWVEIEAFGQSKYKAKRSGGAYTRLVRWKANATPVIR